MPYKIIGSDSKEYSPVELEEIREWIREGRADSNTLVCEIGETQWVRLRDVSTFSGDLLKDQKDQKIKRIEVIGLFRLTISSLLFFAQSSVVCLLE